MSARALLPTGVPVEIYSSRVLINISCCLTEIVMLKILPRWLGASATRPRGSDPQGGEERFLGYLHAPYLLHAAFALFLLFEELALAGDISTVAFCRHVLAVGAHRLAGDDPLPHRRSGDQNLDLYEVGGLVALELIVEGGVTLRAALQRIEEVRDDLRKRQVVGQLHAARRDVLHPNRGTAPLMAEAHERADMLLRSY